MWQFFVDLKIFCPPPQKLYPTTANFPWKITLKILTKFCLKNYLHRSWITFEGNSVTKAPSKSIPQTSQFYKQIFTKITKEIETSGVQFLWENFCYWISFEILVEICLLNSVTKVSLKNYTPGNSRCQGKSSGQKKTVMWTLLKFYNTSSD